MQIEKTTIKKKTHHRVYAYFDVELIHLCERKYCWILTLMSEFCVFIKNFDVGQ